MGTSHGALAVQFLGNGNPRKNLRGTGSMLTHGNRIPLEIQRDL